jgi:hypothetical protein
MQAKNGPHGASFAVAQRWTTSHVRFYRIDNDRHAGAEGSCGRLKLSADVLRKANGNTPIVLYLLAFPDPGRSSADNSAWFTRSRLNVENASK